MNYPRMVQREYHDSVDLVCGPQHHHGLKRVLYLVDGRVAHTVDAG